MERTQIYLDSELRSTLIHRAKRQGVSMSELVRRLLASQLKKDEEAASDAEVYFQNLKPLESFEQVEPEEWVRDLRSGSRLLR